MKFGEALTLLNAGHKVTRAGWNGKGMWIELQRPDINSKMTLPYLFLAYPDGRTVPWLASQTDLLESDWDVRGAEEESNQPSTFTLNVQQVMAMKKAGMWKTAPPIAENHKKPHWTQTAKGKKILANRKPRGKTK